MKRTKISENNNKKFREDISKLQQKYNDVTLVAGVDKTEIPAHRIVLSACSPYFNSMFDSQLKESFEKMVIINDVSGDILAQLVRFCYTGEIEINDGNVQSLFEASHLMELIFVTQKCNEYIISQLDVENCFGCVALARKYDLPALLQTSHSFILNHFENIYEGDEFNEIDVNYLSEILKTDHLNISSEEHVFYAILKWIDYEPSRLTFAEDLIKLFRAKHVKKEFITTNFESFCLENDLLDLLLETYKQVFCSYDNYPWRIGGNKIVAFSFEECINAYVYCASTNTWSLWREVTLPTAYHKYYQCIQLSNDNLFIYNNKLPSVFWKININSCELVKQFYLPTPINWFSFISIDEDVYTVGGFNDNDIVQNILLKYHSASEKWISLASMPVPRVYHKVVLFNSFIYAIGGQTERIAPCASMERYDFKSNTWTNCAPMKVRRSYFGAAAFEGYIYVGGGVMETGFTNSVERYDPQTDSWMSVASMPVAKYSFGFFAHGNALYAAGDLSTKGGFAPFHKYDPKDNRWEELSPLPREFQTALFSVKVVDITPTKINIL